MAGLRPAALRRDDAAPGLLTDSRDVGAVFYPSLRPNAPSGTVGDPRAADAARAEPYLDAWVDWLVEAYEDAKKRHQTKGTVKA